MTSLPPQWSDEELTHDAALSEERFRSVRLGASAWPAHYRSARHKFELLFDKLGDLQASQVSDAALLDVYASQLGDALRYLSGPPISDDDLKIIADVASLAPRVLAQDAGTVRKVFAVIERVIDPFRFPWVGTGKGRKLR